MSLKILFIIFEKKPPRLLIEVI